MKKKKQRRERERESRLLFNVRNQITSFSPSSNKVVSITSDFDSIMNIRRSEETVKVKTLHNSTRERTGTFVIA